MGIREDMEGDVTAAVSGGPRITVRKRTAAEPSELAVPLTHKHVSGLRSQTYIDEDGRRRSTYVQGRVPQYSADCKACIAEDKARMAAPAPDYDFESTIFMVPEHSPDADVARAYLAQRYPGKDVMSLSTIRPSRLALVAGAQVVVVTRRVPPGQRFIGPATKAMEDRFGNIVDVAVPPDSYVNEIVESAPILVADCVSATAATMITDAQVDVSELGERLCDVAAPRYFMAQYQRVVGNDEVVFTMRLNG